MRPTLHFQEISSLVGLHGFQERLLVKRGWQHPSPHDKCDRAEGAAGRADATPDAAVQIQRPRILVAHGQRISRAAIDAAPACGAKIAVVYGFETGVQDHARLRLREGGLEDHGMTSAAVAEKVDLLPVEGRMDQTCLFHFFQDRKRLLLGNLPASFSIDNELGPHAEGHADLIWLSAIIGFVDQFGLMAAEAGRDSQWVVFFDIGRNLMIGVNDIVGLNLFIHWDHTGRRVDDPHRPLVGIHGGKITSDFC
jgi:hypothetical protein